MRIVRVRRHLTGSRKSQLNHFLYGLLIYSFAGTVIAGVLPAITGSGVEPGLGSYFGLPWVVLTFYAIVRYSLFEIRVIFSRTLTIIILVVACSVLQAASIAAISPALGTLLSIVVSLSFLGFFLFGTPVSRKLRAFMDSLIVGKRYNYETLTREAIITLNAKKEMHELLGSLAALASSGPGVPAAGVYVHRVEDGFLLREGTGFFLTLRNQACLSDIAIRKLQETAQPVILDEISSSAGEDPDAFSLTTYLRGIRAEALVPLLFQGRLQGALVLGAKKNGEKYGQSDLLFLETLAAHAASALENARLNDITRRVRSLLKESEERFMSLAQRMPAAVFIHRAGAIIYANAAAEAITGHTASRLTTMALSELLHPEPPESFPARRASTTYQAAQEVRVLQANGSQRWAVMTSAVIEYGEQAAGIAILFDITEHKRTEGKLRYERIRDAVGRMAAYLSGNLENFVNDLRLVAALQEYGEEGHRYPESARKITAMLQQAEILVRTVREFSQRRESKRSFQDLAELVSGRRQLLAAMLTGKCELILQSSPEPLPVMADPTRIESALMHLLLSARERMHRGGAVTLATGRTTLDADFVLRTGYGRIGPYAAISVSDTGEAMTAAEQERIFEPFFKPGSHWQGDGIGLSMVYDIVKEHEGYITVTSRPEGGTVCTTYLPLYDGRKPS